MSEPLPHSVPANSPANVDGVRIGLLAPSFAAPPKRGLPPEKEGPAGQDDEPQHVDPADLSVERLMSGVSLEVLQRGRVILLQANPGGKAPLPGTPILLARTNDAGELVHIEPSQVDGPVPEEPTRIIRFRPGNEYFCFWTFENRKKLFHDVLADVRRSRATAVIANPFFRFKVAPAANLYAHARRLATFLGAIPTPRAAVLGAMLFHGGEGLFGDELIHGVFSGGDLHWAATPPDREPPPIMTAGAKPEKPQDKGPEDFMQGILKSIGVGGTLQPEAGYVIARADALGALYVAELLVRAIERSNQDSFQSWGVFESVKDLCRQAALDERNEHLERTFGKWPGSSYGPGGDNEAYRKWAYGCARRGVRRDRFVKSLRLGDSDWKETVDDIERRHSLHHPANYPGTGENKLQPDEKGILAYFDFYQFGKAQRKSPWMTLIDKQRTLATGIVKKLSLRLGRFRQARARTDLFLKDLDAHHVYGEGSKDQMKEERRTMFARFASTSVHVDYKWWLDLPGDDEQRDAALDKYLDWIGTGSDKAGVLLEPVFNIEAALKYNSLLNEGVGEFEKMFAKLDKTNAHLGGETVKSHLPNEGWIEVDFAKKAFVVKHVDEGGVARVTMEIGPVHFFPKDAATAARAKPAYKEKLPFRRKEGLPSFLGAFGDFLSLVLCLKNLGEVMKQDGWQAGATIAMNTVQACTSVADFMRFAMKLPNKPGWLLEFAKGVGTILEAVLNVSEGLTLYFGDNSEVLKALEAGDKKRAKWLMLRGWVLLSSAVPGVTAFGVGIFDAAVMATAISTLGVSLAIAAAMVVVIDVVLYVRNGPANVMDAVQKSLDAALDAEGIGADLRGTDHTKAYEALRAVVSESWDVLHACDGIQ